MSEPRDVAIVGGGVAGLAVAAELARRGVAVTVFDRGRMGHGCSYGNAGWLTPSLAVPLPAPGVVRSGLRMLLDPDGPFYIPPRLDPSLAWWLVRFAVAGRRGPFDRGTAASIELANWTVDAWEALAARGPDRFGFDRSGLLALYATRRGLAAGRAHAEHVARFGIRHETWDADRVRATEPCVTGPLIGAIHYPDDARCEPWPAVRRLAEEAAAAGATLVEDVDVVDVESDGARVLALTTTRGPVPVGELVVATGAWSRSFGRRLGLNLPVLGAKGYSLVLPPLARQPGRSLYVHERKIAINPHARALRLSGTLELVGEDLSVTTRRVRAILSGARAMIDLPERPEVRELWRGLRPCTPDGMPLVGRARGTRNVWLATGHQMSGVKTGLATGLLLAELMCGEPPSFDPEPFRADRY